MPDTTAPTMTDPMTERRDRHLTAWIVDPIGYTGLIYYDVSLATALAAVGEDVVLVTSDARIDGLDSRVPEIRVFHGTAKGPRLVRGARHVASLVRLAAIALRRRPALMHWQYLAVPTADVITIWLLRRAGIRHVYTAHEVMPWRSSRRVAWAMRVLYRAVDAVIVHHETDVVPVREIAERDVRAAVIGHGSFELFARPELSQEEARARLGLSRTAPLALFFGSLREGKGLDDLLEAWPTVVARLPEARLLIVGKPSRQITREWVTSTIQRSGVDETVDQVLELVDTATANACYRAADVVVLPYREITTSGVLRYAWSSGRAVVATSVGEHRDLVTPEVGVLVAPADPPRLAGAIVDVLSDPSAAAEMGHAALETARRDLSWATAAGQTGALYRSITTPAN